MRSITPKRVKDFECQIAFLEEENAGLKLRIEDECKEYQEFCETARKEMAIIDKAFKLACQEIVDHVGNCPYDAKNLEFPPKEWCDEHCYDGERNPLMCWDVYLLEQARKELGIKDD